MAWRGSNADTALALMEDSRREFYTSQLVRLELLPKPIFFKQKAEVEFYQAHFNLVKGEQVLNQELGKAAEELAHRYGIAAMDALHLAAALNQGVKEFITTEAPSKPIFRVRGIHVVSIHAMR